MVGVYLVPNLVVQLREVKMNWKAYYALFNEMGSVFASTIFTCSPDTSTTTLI